MKNQDTGQDGTDKRSSDIDRYERLQIAAERQIENVWRAHDKHASLIKTVVFTIVAVGGFFFWSSIHGFKNDIRDTMQGQLTNMSLRVDSDLATLTNKAEAKIAELSKRIDTAIDERFRKENIEPLIEAKVKSKVEQVTEKSITEAVRNQLDPPVTRITNEMHAVQEDISRAEASSKEAREALDLAMTIVSALSDDRKAFDKLIEIRDRVL